MGVPPAAARLRVMIVEDSHVMREFLEFVISQDPRLEVVASVSTGEEALRKLERVRPDVISMDIHLPGINGFEACTRIMEDWPTPIVIVSASIKPTDIENTMKALSAGALSVVEKPVAMGHQDYEVLTERLCTQLAIMSQVKVVRQRRKPAYHGDRSPQSSVDAGEATLGRVAMVGIVASTGGPNALHQVLGPLARDFPIPILVVQHISASFAQGFVDWLNSICELNVVAAEAGMRPVGGNIYVAPAEHHMVLESGRLRLCNDDPVCAQRPSGTVLLRSMARELGRHGLGILLTGMGEDGAQGLLEMRNRGAHTISESAETAVVFGMPAAAERLGASGEVLPLLSIAARLRTLAIREQVSS